MKHLLLFHVLFFWRLYGNPFELATSELLSTFFPSWTFLGRRIRTRRTLTNDPHYWLNFHAHPVLSSYYPPQLFTAWVGSFLGLDGAFSLFVRSILLHFLFQSVGWFLFLKTFLPSEICLFGALAFTYQAYHMKQQPCFVYTVSWFPWTLYGLFSNDLILASIAFGMMGLAGYYPITMYLAPVAILVRAPESIIAGAIGALLSLPQLVPFLKLLPKTIRTARSHAVETGFWEKSFFVGWPVLILFLFNIRAGWPVLLPAALAVVFSRNLPRVPYRAWILSAYGVILYALLCARCLSPGAISGLTALLGLDLIRKNANLLPTRPFCELQKRPSRAFNTPLTRFLEKEGDVRVSGLPFPIFTGHVNGLKTLGYSGGMQLRLMARFRNDQDPNGGGEHDWFRSNEDSERLDRYRVKYAYTRKRIDWIPTRVRNLYANPRI